MTCQKTSFIKIQSGEMGKIHFGSWQKEIIQLWQILKDGTCHMSPRFIQGNG